MRGMGRLPFDASKMAAVRAQANKPQADDRPWSVRELAGRIADALATGLPPRIRVTGEISGLRERTHLYFDVKDADAVMACVMFASAARRLPMPLRDGMSVVLSGRVDLYAKAGKLSFIADKAEPVGAGALDLAFRALCAELRELGWFDDARKRRPPLLPRRIAVVTSRTGAALQDVLETARQRCPAVGFVLADVRVQGEGAAAEIARTIRLIGANHQSLAIDAILVTRGGGSLEDLWSFNEREVAEAILKSPVPVVAAIGHETDTTIAELVADARASTPTQAAMLLCPDAAALLRQLESQHDRLSRRVRALLSAERRHLESVARRPALRDPAGLVHPSRRALVQVQRDLMRAARESLSTRRIGLERIARRLEAHRPAARHARDRARLEAAADRLSRVMSRRVRLDVASVESRLTHAIAEAVRGRSSALSARHRELEAVGPRSVLNRGYSVTTLEDGTVIKHESDIRPGQTLVTRLATGRIRSIVEGGSPAQPSRRQARPPAAGPDEPGLFGSGAG